MILKHVGVGALQAPGKGLAGLDGVPLGYGLQRVLDSAVAGSGGSPAWRSRKSAEAQGLLALSRLAPKRISVEQLDLSESLRAVIHMRAAVPTRRPGSAELVIASGALLGLQYRQAAVLAPQPGASFIQILEPEGVFLAQVPAAPPWCLCLAPVLPAGIQCSELILMSYAALTLQTFQIDVRDPAGIFNAQAARWWQDNASRIPLSREPFMELPAESKEVRQ
jgi:hypothetical protein